MTSDQLELVLDNMSGFSDCLKTCFDISSNKVFFRNYHKQETGPYIDVTNIVKEIYRFLWRDCFEIKNNFERSVVSMLDSDTFERFLKTNNYQNKKITITITTNKIIDGEEEIVQEDITEFIYTLFVSIRNYIRDQIYGLTPDGLSKLLLNQK